MQKPVGRGVQAEVCVLSFVFHSDFSVFHLKFSDMAACLDIFVLRNALNEHLWKN